MQEKVEFLKLRKKFRAMAGLTMEYYKEREQKVLANMKNKPDYAADFVAQLHSINTALMVLP